MNTRSIGIYSGAAVAGGIFGGVLALTMLGYRAPESNVLSGSTASSKPLIVRIRPTHPVEGVDSQTSARLSDLRLAPESKASDDETRLGEVLAAHDPEAIRVFSAGLTGTPEIAGLARVAGTTPLPFDQAPIDTALMSIDSALAERAADDYRDPSDTNFTADGGDGRLHFEPVSTDPRPAADTAKLFNHDNGLRGFMAHNWINQNFGVQGGLAIQEERLRQDRDRLDLRDNVAVGMGVLFAF